MRNKSVLALAGVLALSATAFAGTAPAPKKKAPKCGETYVIGKDQGRTTLTQAQVDEVMKTKVGEVEACWTGLSDDQRAKDTTAVLKLEIDDTGEVQTVIIDNQPDELQHCVAIAAAGWEFPRTSVKEDAATFSYAVALKGAAPTKTAQK